MATQEHAITALLAHDAAHDPPPPAPLRRAPPPASTFHSLMDDGIANRTHARPAYVRSCGRGVYHEGSPASEDEETPDIRITSPNESRTAQHRRAAEAADTIAGMHTTWTSPPPPPPPPPPTLAALRGEPEPEDLNLQIPTTTRTAAGKKKAKKQPTKNPRFFNFMLTWVPEGSLTGPDKIKREEAFIVALKQTYKGRIKLGSLYSRGFIERCPLTDKEHFHLLVGWSHGDAVAPSAYRRMFQNHFANEYHGPHHGNAFPKISIDVKGVAAAREDIYRSLGYCSKENGPSIVMPKCAKWLIARGEKVAKGTVAPEDLPITCMPMCYGEVPHSGERGGQGQRNDIRAMCDEITEHGDMVVAANKHPDTFVKFHAGLKAFAQLNAKVPPIAPNCRGIWITSLLKENSGIGKSFYARHMLKDDKGVHFPFSSIYCCDADNKWMDGIDPLKCRVLLVDDLDFETARPWQSKMKRMADVYPCMGESKGSKYYLRHERFVVTSQHQIEELYPESTVQEAIKRRFKVINLEPRLFDTPVTNVDVEPTVQTDTPEIEEIDGEDFPMDDLDLNDDELASMVDDLVTDEAEEALVASDEEEMEHFL